MDLSCELNLDSAFFYVLNITSNLIAKKVRRREVGELSKIATKLRKFYTVMKCRNYGEGGHNVRTCILKKKNEASQSNSRPSIKEQRGK